MFGLPGGCILPAYDPLLDSSIRHILVRHEQGAGHMAEGYAHVTGRPGVAMVTSGPAATNMVTPLMDAYMDSIPMVAITGQVPTSAIGTDAFQECDTVGITRWVTKHNELVMTAQDVPMAVRQAFHIATTGRPGPTLIDVPKDVLQNTMEWYWPTDDEVADSLPGYRPNTKGHPRMIKEAAKLILASERPILYVGGGILKAHAAEALRELAEMTDIHVVTTLMARGAFPDDHPLCLGMPGMHGNATAITALQKADLLITLGARFDDRITGKVSTFAPEAKIIHVDIDPAEQGKVRRPDVPIVGDCRQVIERAHQGDPRPAGQRRRAGRHRRVEEPDQRLARAVPADLRAERARRGAEAAVLPRAAARQRPRGHDPRQRRRPAPDVEQPVLAVQRAVHVGQLRWPRHDGLQRAGGDRRQGRPAGPHGVGHRRRRLLPDDRPGAGDRAASSASRSRSAILNNSYLGMVRQWQEMFYDERYSEVYLSPELPDFVKWAEAMGCVGIRVDSPEEVQPAIDKANSIDDRPVVVDFRVDAREKVFPMVPAGMGNDDLILPDIADGPEGLR